MPNECGIVTRGTALERNEQPYGDRQHNVDSDFND